MLFYLNYLLDWPHTDEQMQSLISNTSVMLREAGHWYHCLSFWLSLNISSCIMPAHWCHITALLFLCIPSRLLCLWGMNIKHYLSPDPTYPCEPHLLIDTELSRDTKLGPLRSEWNMVLVRRVFHYIFYPAAFSSIDIGDREGLKNVVAPQHMLCSLFRLLPPCHLSQVPSLTYCINF